MHHDRPAGRRAPPLRVGRRAQRAVPVQDPALLGPERGGLAEDLPVARARYPALRDALVLREVQCETADQAALRAVQLDGGRQAQQRQVRPAPHGERAVRIRLLDLPRGRRRRHERQIRNGVDLGQRPAQMGLQLFRVARRLHGVLRFHERPLGPLRVMPQRGVEQQRGEHHGQQRGQHARRVRCMAKPGSHGRHAQHGGERAAERGPERPGGLRTRRHDRQARRAPGDDGGRRRHGVTAPVPPGDPCRHEHHDAAPDRADGRQQQPCQQSRAPGIPWRQGGVQEIHGRRRHRVGGDGLQSAQDRGQHDAPGQVRRQEPRRAARRQPPPGAARREAGAFQAQRRQQRQRDGERAQEQQIGGGPQQAGQVGGAVDLRREQAAACRGRRAGDAQQEHRDGEPRRGQAAEPQVLRGAGPPRREDCSRQHEDEDHQHHER